MEDNRSSRYRCDFMGLRHTMIKCTLAMAVLLCSFSIAASSSHNSERQRDNTGSRHLMHRNHLSSKKPATYLNQIVVNLASPDERLAAALADRYGLMFKGKIEPLSGWYLFEDKRIVKRSIRAPHLPLSMHRLQRDRHVVAAERLKALKRVRRSQLPTLSHRNAPSTDPNDPAWRRMWYMHCGGANNSDCPTSMRISDSWRAGYAGSGIVVTILDDGIETSHPDLRRNYDANASRDINNGDDDPTPRYDLSNENKHGTRCAGVVAAVSGNNICSIGVAYKARIGGIRMLDGEVTDSVEARSLGYNREYIDIYSASWGPDDDGNTVEGPGLLAKAAFEQGARLGRGGKGSIFVWASGNGGHNKDSCSCDGYINSIYTIAISSVSQNGRRPWYLESCASTLATTYSSGEVNEGKVITTDLRAQCTYQHTGTSASAPMAAGVIALMLEANENLTWRDVQHIIVRTSNPKGLEARDWIVNGAGYNVSHVFGFGLMDALQLTHVARNWRTVPVQRPITVTSAGVELESEGCRGGANEINHLEHVILRITLNHSCRGALRIYLRSPHGTVSNILERSLSIPVDIEMTVTIRQLKTFNVLNDLTYEVTLKHDTAGTCFDKQSRSLDKSREGFQDWEFMTTHHWGEHPQGLWRLRIEDHYFRPRYRSAGRDPTAVNQLVSWQLIFYGTYEDPQSNFSLNTCDAYPQHQCHAECKGCCGATAMECKSCKHVSTSKGVCIRSCPSEQFPHPSTKICQPCWKTCTECSGPHAGNCTACKMGYSLLNGRCILQCSAGHFLDNVTQRCMSCHQSCKTCSRKRDNCTSCRDGFQKSGNSCHASCPTGTYIASYQTGCAFCHRHCEDCIGPSELQCTHCANGLILHRKRCVRSCPRRSYHDVDRGTCRSCHKSCKTCRGQSSKDCLTCEANQELRVGECRKPCRDDFKRNYSTNPCVFVVKIDMCHIEILRDICCHTCEMFETGELFLPTNVSMKEDLASISDIDYDDEYYDSSDDYDLSPLSTSNEITDYREEAQQPVHGELQLETGNPEAGSQTPIIVESGMGFKKSRKVSNEPSVSDNNEA